MLTAVAPAKTEEAAREVVSIQATIPRSGDFIAFGFDSLWMISGQRLARISTADNSVVDIRVEGLTGQNRGIAIGEGAVWLSDVGGSTVHAVGPRTNQVVATIKTAKLRGTEGSIGVGEGSVWVVISENRNRVLARYNTRTGAEIARIALPSTSSGVLVDFGAVWVTGTEKGELYRIDPESNHIAATIALHARPRFLTSGEGSVWVLNQLDGTVQRIDGKTGKLLATIEAGAAGGGGDIAAGGGFIWVTSLLLPVIQIDPTTNSVRGKFRAPSSVDMGDAIRYGSGSLWVSGGSVFRITPPE
jgi:streptogramin lyase